MSKDEVLRMSQGISRPPVPRFSVRVEVVDKIDEGFYQRTSPVNIKQVRDVRLGSLESADRVGEEMGKNCCVRSRKRA